MYMQENHHHHHHLPFFLLDTNSAATNNNNPEQQHQIPAKRSNETFFIPFPLCTPGQTRPASLTHSLTRSLNSKRGPERGRAARKHTNFLHPKIPSTQPQKSRANTYTMHTYIHAHIYMHTHTHTHTHTNTNKQTKCITKNNAAATTLCRCLSDCCQQQTSAAADCPIHMQCVLA